MSPSLRPKPLDVAELDPRFAGLVEALSDDNLVVMSNYWEVGDGLAFVIAVRGAEGLHDFIQLLDGIRGDARSPANGIAMEVRIYWDRIAVPGADRHAYPNWAFFDVYFTDEKGHTPGASLLRAVTTSATLRRDLARASAAAHGPGAGRHAPAMTDPAPIRSVDPDLRPLVIALAAQGFVVLRARNDEGAARFNLLTREPEGVRRLGEAVGRMHNRLQGTGHAEVELLWESSDARRRHQGGSGWLEFLVELIIFDVARGLNRRSSPTLPRRLSPSRRSPS